MPKITNSSRSENVSLLLQSLSEQAKAQDASIELTRDQVEGTKGSLILEVVIGLGINATWDLIKFAAQKLHQVSWSDDDKIEVDGVEQSIGDLRD